MANNGAMPGLSKATHDSKTLREIADWLDGLVNDFRSIADEYRDDGASLPVTRDDQRRRAIKYLNNFRAAAVTALHDHRESKLKKQAPKPKKIVKLADGTDPK